MDELFTEIEDTLNKLEENIKTQKYELTQIMKVPVDIDELHQRYVDIMIEEENNKHKIERLQYKSMVLKKNKDKVKNNKEIIIMMDNIINF